MDEIEDGVAPEGVTEEVVTEAEQAEQVEEAAGEQPDGEEPSKAQSRRERRKAAMAAIRREADEAKEKLRQTEEAHKRAREAVDGNIPPKEDDFPDYNAYLIALGQHHAMRALDGRAVKDAEQAKAAEEQRIAQLSDQHRKAALDGWMEQVEEAKTRYADFEQVAMYAPLSDEACQLVMDCDNAADVAYYLGQNPDMARRISAMQPLEMARELGRIEARLSAPQPKRVSDAPAPISPVKAKGAARRSPDSMSYEEFCKARAEGWSP